ncbi:MAG: ADP-ribose pyrophosphatase [Candidatus Marinimicrobia bacterium]|nr:ADP-ribose pyrophosphatase [Candidatus Neomarinimicrobiota bacterium]|tara:strand:- start:26135 stop:26689 length:555 start_codon:yes stop_codon:yes gene_type:complete
MKDLTESKISSEKVFSGNFINVSKDTVSLPNGLTSTREYILHPGAVVILPLLKNREILLIKQYRYSIGCLEIEIPAGKIDPGEKPIDAANRELEEETGYCSSKITLLQEIHPCIGYSDERMWLYLAEDLVKGKIGGDEDEFIESIPTPLDEALGMIQMGKITDVKAIIGLFWADKLRRGDWQLP